MGPVERLDPAGAEGVGVFGYVDRSIAWVRLRLADPALLERALGRHDARPIAGSTRSILETLILREDVGMSADDIAAKRGIAYASGIDEACTGRRVERRGRRRSCSARPRSSQVRAVAEAGETMPPKSTYFFPKLPTGLVFNPLS